ETAESPYCCHLWSLLHPRKAGALEWEKCNDLVVAWERSKEDISPGEMGPHSHCRPGRMPLHNRSGVCRVRTHQQDRDRSRLRERGATGEEIYGPAAGTRVPGSI